MQLLLQLIKTMKQSLMKQTATAMKSAQHHPVKHKQSAKQKASSRSQLKAESDNDAVQADHGRTKSPA